MLEDRKVVESLKNLDFEMLCAVADSIEDLGNEQGFDTLSNEVVEFDINLSKAINERVQELLLAEKMVKAILS